MRSNSESKQSSKQQQSSKTAKEGVSSQRENNSSKNQSKSKVKNCVAPSFSDQPHEQRREADGKLLLQPKSSGRQHGQCVKGKTKRDDELVKYMSNLPGYLKRMEDGENPQDKAFNVGVLDWSRLQQWKYNQNCNNARGTNNGASTSSSLPLKTIKKSSSLSSAAKGGTHAHQSVQHPSLFPSLNSSYKDDLSQGVQPSIKKAVHFQDFDSSSKGNLGQRKTLWTYKSFGKNNADVALKSGKPKVSAQKITSDMGDSSSNLRHYEDELSPKEKVAAWGEVKKRVEVSQESDRNRRPPSHNIISEAVANPKLRTYGVSRSLKAKIDCGNVETKKRIDKFQESNSDLGHRNLPGKLESVVLLLPRDFSQKGSLEEPKVLLNENLIETNQNSLSGSFPVENNCYAELCSDIPHSCPLPSKVETKVEPYLVSHSRNNSIKLELTSDASYRIPSSNKISSMLSEGKDTEQKTVRHLKANTIENLKILDQEMADMAAMKGRNPSPNRRFSFSLGRMSRSLSSKEGSNVPQLNSTYVSAKSGPVKSEEPSSVDDSNREKAKGNNRARSSPLRRILDPLLRSKGSSNPVQEAGSFQPCKESSSYFSSRPINSNDSLLNQRHGSSKIRALLQLSIKNGIPLFKFVVDSNSSVLAATMNNLTSTGKDDLGQNYTFYSVDEIKKKSGGWISQGSKVKSSGYAYNVLGQMKVSGSHYPDSDFKNQYIMRESVLFGVEVTQADQASPKYIISKEIAAIEVKLPIESLSHQAKSRDKGTVDKGFTEHLLGGGCTTVIIPSGDHSLPSKGAPSPLIQRWKSGGVCDCGGWDDGCKLRILANHNRSSKISTTSNVFSDSTPFELFTLGEEPQQNRSVFSLVPLNKEIYSVEFDSSVSLLRAFFICVTVISCQKSSDLSGVSNLYEAKVFDEEPKPWMNGDGVKKNHPSNIILGGLPRKYAPNPPHSPVGRA
ncbi:hypothetical protein EZV62_016552 [Acer yangbiense]|uniref:DUF3527 domain-containing protein n=1 Tax=Acer yangbiense TaxID=1000413 RepID=A0A5C7HNT0_9ROSI|nr:hypothetical protein EZV62_016552 [Acer yangbiense]